jgi:hypothetical protein
MDPKNLDLLVLQVAVIFLPGIIWARLDVSYAAKVKPSETEFILRAFLFGLTVYAIEFILYSLCGWQFTMADLGGLATKEVISRQIAWEVLWAVLISIVLSICWLYAATHKLLTRFLQFINATKKYGDEDVWDFVLNSGETAVGYVHVRDNETGYVYTGWIDTFSETDRLRELVLLEVIVYNLDGVKQYEMPRLYLARAPDNINLEFPYKD